MNKVRNCVLLADHSFFDGLDGWEFIIVANDLRSIICYKNL
jgi:hypothetical protein